jgi:Domain of unknown function (DUF5615)
LKLLLDEQISDKVADRLRERNHDVVAATNDLSLRGLSDPDLFEAAQAQGRGVVTYNRVDFEPITRQYAQGNREHHGLILVHPRRFPSSEFGGLVAAMDDLLNGPDLGMSYVIWLQKTK